MNDRHLVLVGLMGSGKTTVGEECARRLGRDFVDTDAMVEAVAGRTVAEIFDAEGEAGFRARERDAVADACERRPPAVVACGGGAVIDPANRRRLRASGFVVWLTAEPAELAARVGTGAGRPLLAGATPGTVLTGLAAQRGAAYEDAAHAVVDTTGLDVAAVADRVLEEFGA